MNNKHRPTSFRFCTSSECLRCTVFAFINLPLSLYSCIPSRSPWFTIFQKSICSEYPKRCCQTKAFFVTFWVFYVLPLVDHSKHLIRTVLHGYSQRRSRHRSSSLTLFRRRKLLTTRWTEITLQPRLQLSPGKYSTFFVSHFFFLPKAAYRTTSPQNSAVSFYAFATVTSTDVSNRRILPKKQESFNI